MMKKKPKEKNYAYIDAQNLYCGIKDRGWELDYQKFRIYLKEKYRVETAYLFIGYIQQNQSLYQRLQKFGYILIFKPVIPNDEGKHKGNVDTDLVLRAIIDYYEKNFDKAVVVSSDGDFYCLVSYLYENNALKTVLSPYKKHCSLLLKQSAKEKIVFMDNLESKLAHKKRKHRLKTKH